MKQEAGLEQLLPLTSDKLKADEGAHSWTTSMSPTCNP
jgi:F-type H+-transporting ATPase subunit gamma